MASSAALFISSLAFGILALGYANKSSIAMPQSPSGNRLTLVLSIATALVGTLVAYTMLSGIFEKSDYGNSDVLLLVELMVERLLAGDFPYTPTYEWKYTITPTYLPMLWLPFISAEWLSFDYRWVPFIVLVIALVCYQYRIYKFETRPVALVLLSALPWLVWVLLIYKLPNIFVVSIETMNIAYYLLFGLAILWQKTRPIGISLAICLMARFSFVLWLPLLGICYLLVDKKAIIQIVLISLLLFLAFYVFPFLIKDLSSLTDSIGSYSMAAVGEWSREYGPYDRPFHLFRGQGMAVFYYEYIDGDMVSRVKALQLSHLILSAGSLLLLLGYFIKNRNTINLSIFLLASLSVYFAFFYNFIQVPYSYLFLVPLFVNILIWVELVMSWRSKGGKTLK